MEILSSCLHKGQGWKNSFTTPWTATIKELCQLALLPACFLFMLCELLVVYEVITDSALEAVLSQRMFLFLLILPYSAA